MTVPAAPYPCGGCGMPLAAGSEFCTNCGTALRPVVAWRSPERTNRSLIVGTGVAAAIVAVGAVTAILLVGGGDSATSSPASAASPVAVPTATVTTIIRTRTVGTAARRSSPAPQPVPAAASPRSAGAWPAGTTGYSVFLGALSTEARARVVQDRANASGLNAGILESSRFSSLRPGYWVVFTGIYPDKSSISSHVALAREKGFSDAYARLVSP